MISRRVRLLIPKSWPCISILLVTALAALLLMIGCGGGGGGDGAITGLVAGGSIVGKVVAPDDLRLSARPVVAGSGREVPRATVWLEAQPDKVYLTDIDGRFTIPGAAPGIAHRVVCRYDVAATGEIYLTRSPEIILADAAKVSEAGDLELEKGKYSISGLLRDQFGAVVADAKLSLWGIPFKSGLDGRFITPALPESAAEEKISIEAAGYREISITLPFLHSQNTSSGIEITLPDKSEPNFSPVVFFAAAPQQVAPGERVGLKISVIDPDEFATDHFKPVWNEPPGRIETTSDRMLIYWTAPDSPGLATISVSVKDSRGAAAAASLVIAVGGDRNPVIRIEKITPASAPVGALVLISGSGFGNRPQAVAVSFNGLAAVVKSCSDNEIVTEVPAAASTGILVISCNGSEKSAGIFAVIDAGLAIAPQFGPPGTVVDLVGRDFGVDPTPGSVRVNGQLATIIAWADTAIRFRVPEDSTAGVVTVNLRGREKTAGIFRVTRLFNISSVKGTTGSLLTITGEGWGSAQSDSVLAFTPGIDAIIKSWTDAKIVFSVPPGAGSGALTATVSDVTFRVADFTINAINRVTPDRGIAGDELTISGIGFGAAATNGYVTIGDARPEILSWTDTAIRIRIPAGTRPGNLMVRAGDIDSNSIPVVITAVTSISYVRRPAGASLTVNGYGFGSNTGFLLFGAAVAEDFAVWNDTKIDTVIPKSATGSVALIVSSLGVRSPAVPFDVTWIDGLDESEGWPGRELIISGNNLGAGAGNDRVTINGVLAPVISWSNREIHLRVPPGTTTGPLVLTISDWPVEITDEFTVYNSFDYRQLSPDWSGRRANSRPLLPGLVEDADGNQFITDYDNGWVWKIAADGRQSKFGNLARPWGIAVSPINKRLYVSESGNNCLRVFDSDGNHLETIGASGSGNGQFKGPRGLAFDSSGRLYVADAGNSRVQVFATTPAPAYLSDFGTSGTANGQLVNPSGVAIDSLLNVYVADAGNHRVQRFSPDSAVAPAAWSFSGWVGSKDPNALTPGWLITGSGLPSSADGGFYNPYGLGLAGDGQLLVADSDNNRVQVINTLTGTFAGQIGAAGTTSGQYNQPLAVFYKNDCVSIADSSNARIQRSTLAGEYISQIIPDTSLLNTRPGRVVVDSTRRRVYVLDIDDGSITVFGFDGQVMQIIGSKGSGNGQFYKPEGLSIDLNGNLFVADTGNARIQIFSPEGVFIKAWGVYGTGASQFINPTALAVSADGAHVFVVDARQNRVQKFSRDGVFVKTWGSYGTADEHFAAPSGIAADQNGHLYIADRNNHRIKKYNTDGSLIGWWGSYDAGAQAFWLDPGSQRSGAASDADGAFDSPTDVAVDSQGNVLVADSGNFRMQRFAADQSSGDAAGWQGEIYTGENLAALAVDNWATVYTIPVGGGLMRFAPDL